jgi:hypothetical protein
MFSFSPLLLQPDITCLTTILNGPGQRIACHQRRYETSPAFTSFVCSLRLNRCDFKGLSTLLISREVLLLWSAGLMVQSCSYCTEGIAFQASARATTRGDEAGACASVAAMIHLPADVLVLHEPVTCSYLHVGVSRRPVTEHYTRWWRRISNQEESSEHCKRESQRFTGAGLPSNKPPQYAR